MDDVRQRLAMLRPVAWPLGVGLLATVIVWVGLETGVAPWMDLLGWMPGFSKRDASHLVLFCVEALLAGLVVRTVQVAVRGPSGRAETAWSLLQLVVLGGALQFAFSFQEGLNLRGLGKNTMQSGHAEFFVLAESTDPGALVPDYERLVAENRIGSHSPSKPPGALLSYIAWRAFSQVVNPPKRATPTAQDVVAATCEAAVVFWPFLTFLFLVPLFFAFRRLAGAEVAWWAAGLSILVPSVQLVTMHLDGVWFPTLFAAACWLEVWAVQRDGWGASAVAGAGLFVAMFFIFPLVTAAVFFVGLVAARTSRERASRDVLHLAAFGGGFLGALAVFRVVLGYDFVSRLVNGLAYHQGFKVAEFTAGVWASAALGNFLQFVEWFGPVGASLFVAALVAGVRGVRGAAVEDRAFIGFSFAFAVLFVYLDAFSRTISEILRLWLFFFPVATGLAVWHLHRRLVSEDARTLAGQLLALSALVTTYALKSHADFW